MKERAEQWPHFAVGSEEVLMGETEGDEDSGPLREDRGYWPCHVIVRKKGIC